MRVVGIVFLLSVTSLACSAGDSSEGKSSSSGGAPSSSGSGAAPCSCSVEVNGDKKVIACGGQACVAGTSYQCDDDANIVESGSACSTSAAPDASTGGGEATTVPCEYHDFDANKDVETCDAATQYCIRAYQSKLGPGSNNVCVPKPSGCTGCPCASAGAEAAWKKANNNTINCTGVTMTCKNTDGAIVVDCVK